MTIFLIFLLGLIFGSFANVLIYRIPKKISILSPRSFCPHCKVSIKWYDNIPILSYVLLLGKCRSCKTKISIEYPLVELLSGILAVLCYLKFNIYTMWIFYNFLFVLLVISFIDLKTTEIPDVLSYYLIISGITLSVFNPLLGIDIFVRISNSIIGGIVGFLFLWNIEFFSRKIFKKPTLGGGDVKLFCAVGTYFGLFSIFKILFYSCIVALVYVLSIGLIKNKKIFGEYIQFAPFVSLGCLFYMLTL
ncbi:MAG: prepilin peptidase [Endomicrobiia bacterium]